VTRKVLVWERFADALLMREAALCRVVSGVPPRDTAGLFVGDDEVDALLRSLPGLDGPDAPSTERIEHLFDPLVEMARSRLRQWSRAEDDSIARVARELGLGSDDVEVLALLAAVELEPHRQRLVSYVQDSVGLPRMTLATLSRLFGSDHRGPAAVAPGAPLRRHAVAEVEPSGPWSTRMCGVAARIVWDAVGRAPIDPDLPLGFRYRSPLKSERQGPPTDPTIGPELLLIHGADPETRRLSAAAAHADHPLFHGSPPADPEGWSSLAREAVASSATVLLEAAGPLDALATTWLERADRVRWAVSSDRELPSDSLPHRRWHEISMTDGEATEDDWRRCFGVAAPVGATLSREQLRTVAAATQGDPDRVPDGIRRLSGGQLDHLAVRLRPRRHWPDLVLPDHQLGQLRELALRHRRKSVVFGAWRFPAIPSSGTVALFAGPSGTGKTLAAEVVAGDLGLDLYKIDLSSVVSKYIGETEKNLERIFTAAAAGELVLFFDEADALFGKRSEVSSAHDRYANIEVAYLLQRLETYEGIVVLATNLQRNIDDAFLRRVGIAVTFAMPDEAHRRRIWSLVFPIEAPTSDIDHDFLARHFAVPGGVIRNVALGAAFAAAEAGTPITMDLVLQAMKHEFTKLGRLSTGSGFERQVNGMSRAP
jgi:hypothetical protein